MTNKQKLITAVILGAAVGTLATIFLQSEKGKKMLSDLKDTAGGLAENLSGSAKAFTDLFSRASKKAEEAMDEFESEEAAAQ